MERGCRGAEVVGRLQCCIAIRGGPASAVAGFIMLMTGDRNVGLSIPSRMIVVMTAMTVVVRTLVMMTLDRR